jgi:hypothetical protein
MYEIISLILQSFLIVQMFVHRFQINSLNLYIERGGLSWEVETWANSHSFSCDQLHGIAGGLAVDSCISILPGDL